jgi:hypothetical protein
MSNTPVEKLGKQSADGKVLWCRRCGCRHFYLVSTRRTRQGRVLCRRECRNCGQRVTRYEDRGQSQNDYRPGPQP